MNIRDFLSEKLRKAFIAAGAAENCNPQICQSSKVQCGDYQANGVMVEAQKFGVSPQQFAKKVLLNLDLNGIANKTKISDPGFINISLDPVFLAKIIDASLKARDLGINKPKPQIIVVDYSSPNIAKEMHVGHLRSTIIGDATVRTLEFLGHTVIRANHIGDWGTQFGMLIAWLEYQKYQNINEIKLSDLEEFYRKAKKHFNENKKFAELSRKYIVKLQNGDAYFLKIWKHLVNLTMSQNQLIYERLKITLSKKDIMGESLYNEMLPEIVLDLKNKGLASNHEGAVVVFLYEFKNKMGKPMGVIVQKKDGGYLYTTTDIACIKYRYEKLHAERIIYYVDNRQQQHLMQVFSIVRRAGYIPDSVSLEHHTFGPVLSEKGKPFKTRSGDTIKLSNLIDEAILRAKRIISEKYPNLLQERLERLANIIGIGALKYADLSKHRETSYIFDWNKMLSFEGNTAPYIQYAYARILSVFRKVDICEYELCDIQMVISNDSEIKLAKKLVQFQETLDLVANQGIPHIMCTYLYDLAGLFSIFYECCPILLSSNRKIYFSRLKLALLTAKTLKCGLNILGIETLDHM